MIKWMLKKITILEALNKCMTTIKEYIGLVADKKVDKKERRHEDGQLGKQYPQSGSVYTGRTAKSDGYDQIKYK